MPVRVCPACQQSTWLTAIAMAVTHGKVTMHRCTACDVSWWETNGQRIGFDSVRHLAGPDPARRNHMQIRKAQRAAA